MLLARLAVTAGAALAALGVPAIGATPAMAAFPGQNGKIAFHTDRDAGNWEIYAMDPDGGNAVNLTSNSAFDSEPAWSADGTRIAYVSYGQRNIYVMNADGSGQTRITHDSNVFDSDPAWSPAGTRIAFTRNDLDSVEIHTMAPDGGSVVRLTDSSAVDGTNEDPAWSPDGSKIVFTSTRDRDEEIYVMDADGSDHVNLTQHPGLDRQPVWSPDGSRIAFVSARDGLFAVYVMDADGGNLTRLTDATAFDEDPAWSPDGTKIAFTSYREGDGEIFVMDTDGGNQVKLTDNGTLDRQPDWQPLRPAPPPGCRADTTGGQESGLVSGPVHGLESPAGPFGPLVHQVNCDVIAPLGL